MSGAGQPTRNRVLTPQDVETLGLVPIAICCTGFNPGEIPRMEIDYGPAGRTAPIAFGDMSPEQMTALFANDASPDLSEP